MRASGRKLVVTNGCFDLLHPGHVTYLENARNFGDALLVGLNGDEATRQLKGPGRPVNSESDRAAVLAALASVDGVCLFVEKTATRFLLAARPDIYVKGGDYTLDTLSQEERGAVEQAGGKIVISRSCRANPPRPCWKKFHGSDGNADAHENSGHFPRGRW